MVSEISTSAGNRNAAICATELTTTEIARSVWRRAASTTPTTCSTALLAIATITRPANACEMCELVDRRGERVDEPVRDEAGADAGDRPAARARRASAIRAGAACSVGAASQRT